MAFIGFCVLGLAGLQVIATAAAGLRSLFAQAWEPPALSSLQFGRMGG